MRIRFWVGLVAVCLIAAGSLAAALIVHHDDEGSFRRMQQDEAGRAARQAESMATLSLGELSSAAAFYRAEQDLDRHEFAVVARSLLRQGVLISTGLVVRVPAAERRRFERSRHLEIVESTSPRGDLSRAGRRRVYFPVLYAVSKRAARLPLGRDLGSDPERAPVLRRARDSGRTAATPVTELTLGGRGLVAYHPVYREGAPTATVRQRRRALLGFLVGSFRVHGLAAAALATVPGNDEAQLRVNHRVVEGTEGQLQGAAWAPIGVADETWILVVRDPNRPGIGLPLLLAVVGISLAALLGALIFVWSRNERMQQLRREASQDSLTGLRNRRRFEEDLRLAMARSHRERTTGALLVIDLDRFKQVNDSLGHPAGDRLIEEIAAVLRHRTRESDVLARLGGDEFAVILPRSSPAEARTAAEAIAAAIREHRSAHNGIEPVTASIGVAVFGEDPRMGIEQVVSAADTAMYAVKDGGRDGVRLFDPQALRDEAPGVS